MVKNHRGRGQVSIAYLALLAAAVLIVVVLVVRQVWRSTTTEVWVTRDGIRAGEVIDASKLVLANVSKTSVPPNAIGDAPALIGKTAQKNVEKGAPVTAADIAEKAPFTFLSDAPPEGKVVITVRATGLAAPASQLRYGDRLELVAVGRAGPRVVGHDMFLLGVMSPLARTENRGGISAMVNATLNRRPTPVAQFLVAVDPGDVMSISKALAEGAALTYVVHGRQEIASGRRVDIASHEGTGEIELIVGASRRAVK